MGRQRRRPCRQIQFPDETECASVVWRGGVNHGHGLKLPQVEELAFTEVITELLVPHKLQSRQQPSMSSRQKLENKSLVELLSI